jgi:hypothetical protein
MVYCFPLRRHRRANGVPYPLVHGTPRPNAAPPAHPKGEEGRRQFAPHTECDGVHALLGGPGMRYLCPSDPSLDRGSIS